MNLVRTQGIIIRSYRYREHDKIVSCYTKMFGKLRLLAYGARRHSSRFSGCLEPLVVAELQFRHQPEGLLRLDGVDIVYPLTRLRSSLAGITSGLYILSLISWFTLDDAPNVELYEEFLGILVALEQGPRDPRTLYRFAELKILEKSGFSPSIQHCSNCGRTSLSRPMQYDPEAGKLYCWTCVQAESSFLTITPAVVGFLRTALKTDAATIAKTVLSNNQHAVVQRFLHRLLLAHFDKAPEFMNLDADPPTEKDGDPT